MNSVVSPHEAVKILSDSGVVALPTETVYGLAGKVTSEAALNLIFSTKSRPFFDPLIVHVKNLDQAKEWAWWDPVSEALAKYFWPGPLTLVLPKKEKVSNLITSAGSTVALRSPNHPLFREVLEKLGEPLAAPSANMFGKTSPTEASHVIAEFAGKVPVVDGGPCEKGIESTVLEVNPESKTLTILRPGVINRDHLNEFCEQKKWDYQVEYKTLEHAPGHLKNHYQPTVPFVLVYESSHTPTFENQQVLEEIQKGDWQALKLPEDAAMAARQLYSQLRSFSQKKQAFYVIVKSHWHSSSQWKGIMDRMEKASTGSIHWTKNQWLHTPK